jgi:hypothetical protein
MLVQTCTAGHPAFFTVVTWSSPVVERPGRVSDHSPSSSAEVANGMKLYLRLPSMPASACHGVTFTFLCRLFIQK